MTVEEWVQKFGATVEDGDDVAALLPNDADDEPPLN
jgi:hypothetical protein